MFEKVNFDGYVEEDHPDRTRWEKVIEEQRVKNIVGETGKAHPRRLREGWFDKYAPADKVGIDLGCSFDPLNLTFRRFDIVFGDGDATVLEGIPQETFWTIYASHLLEHIQYPTKAIQRWYEVLKTGGHLIILVPHRDLYEKKKFLPSMWNPDHKYFWLPDEEQPPCTKSLKKEVLLAIPNANIVSLRVLDEGYDYALQRNEHPIGEYSIELIVQKV